MTKEKINIVIAEECGYRNVHKDEGELLDGLFKDHIIGQFGLKEYFILTPNYAEDLNAMHEVEKVLGTGGKSLASLQKDLFADILVTILNPGRIDYYNPEKHGAPTLSWRGVFSVAQATSRQHAEAFIKTRCPERWVET